MGQRRAIILHIDPLLVHCVTGFVDRAEQPVAQIVLLEACGDADITQGELGHEGMVRLVLPAAIEVITQLTNDHFAELALFHFGKDLMDATVINLWLIENMAQERHDLGAQIGE